MPQEKASSYNPEQSDYYPQQSCRVGDSIDIVVCNPGNDEIQDVPELESAKIIREDSMNPFITIAQLDDGNVILEKEFDGFIPPRQTELNSRVTVWVKKRQHTMQSGFIIRSDAEEPFQTVIQLDRLRGIDRIILFNSSNFSMNKIME